MFYTSGTTGRPKGVRRLAGVGAPIEQGEMMSRGFAMLVGAPIPGVTLLCGPVYHSAQWAFSYLLSMAGSSVVMRHKFDPAETLRLIDQHRVTNVHLVPTQLTRLLRLDEATRRGFDGSSLRAVWHGAAPCPPEVKRRMIEWWGPIVTEYYGGTEGAIVTLIRAPEWLDRPSSVGRPVPGVELSVMAEDGRPCPTGEPGLVYVRSLMAADFEYHGDRDKTAAAHREPGVFSMGDVGYLDAGGYLHLVDRRIDLIISGGVNIYPAEIERVLGDDPRVADAAVFGIPDEEFGEQVMAVIEPAPGIAAGDALREELLALCRSRLAGFKVPRRLEFAALPRTETGKLAKRALRDPYWAASGRRI
jgi:long-chain acyl-CoA synthetase